MPIRFRRSVKIFPGLRINFSKRGTSTTIGGRGASVNLSKRGTRTTFGVPGTGLSYSSSTSSNSKGSTQGGNGCCLLTLPLAIVHSLGYVLQIIIRIIVGLVKFLYNTVAQIYSYLKENPIARRNVIAGSGIIIILTIACFFCVTAFGFIVNLIPTPIPTFTLTLTKTATPTITQSATITLTPTKTTTPTITLSPTITATPTITYTPTKTPTFTQTITNTPGAPTSGFVLIYIDEMASIGGAAEAKIRTQPNALCKLVFVLPSGRESTVDGIGEKIADKDGYCSWWWEVKGNVKPGKGAVVITAGGKTVIYRIKIE